MVKISPLRLPGFDPAQFFQKLLPSERSVSFFTSGEWTVIAWNPTKTIVADDEKALLQAKKSVGRFRGKTALPFVGGLIGWVSYDLGLRLHNLQSRHPKRSGIPGFCFHSYDQALLFDGKKTIAVGSAAFRDSVREIHERPLPQHSLSPIDWKSAISRADYAAAFGKAIHGIREGDEYQMNLSYPFRARSGNDPRLLFAALLTHNPSAAAAYIEHGTSAIISASPERFVLIEDGQIRTCPIKGTRPRGKNSREDARFVSELLRSTKEQAELNMITDLLRNDVGKISKPGTVFVRGHRLLQQNPSVWHTYSVIEGELQASLHPFDAFLSMFPGGSVTGCPKIAAMEEIDRLESQRRGPYCGSAVMLSASGRLDSTILIRTVVKDGVRLSLGVGGGIVADSTLSGEFEETRRKADRILSLPVRRTWINGKEVSSDSRLKLLDPSRKDSVGVFETMRAQGRQIIGLSAHLKRLKTSAKLTGPGLKYSDAAIRSQLLKALSRAGDGSIRIKIVASGGDLLIETRPFVTESADVFGVAVSVTDLERTVPAAKALPCHREWIAYRAAVASGFGETLLRRSDGSIPEAAISNLFFVRRGTLFTARSEMLPGITRASVMSLARSLKIPVRFATPTLKDLLTVDEVFLTRSTAGIVPVVRIRDRRLGSGKPGRLTRKLRKAFSARVLRQS